MGLSPLHTLAEMIRQGEYIQDRELLDILGSDSTIVVPLSGGGERHIPSGEILSVLADGAGLSVEQVLARNFRLNPEEVEAARNMIDLVQFSGGVPEESPGEQPIQPFDR